MINFEVTKEFERHFEAFWNVDYFERCNLVIKVPTEKRTVVPCNIPCNSLEERYTNPELIYNRYLNSAMNTMCYGEAFNGNYINFGTAAHASYFGAKQHYAENTIWFDEVINGENDDNADLLVYSQQGKKEFEKHLEIISRVAELSKGQFFTGMADNCGIMDSLALLRGNQNLLIDMIENPEFVTEAIDKIIPVWNDTQNAFFNAIKENNLGGSSHGWMQTWSNGRHAQIQCDYSVMISPQMYEQFVLPELIKTSALLDHTSYHLDGQEQIRHLDHILSVDTIQNIQWTPVDGQPVTSYFMSTLQRIQKAGKGLILIPRQLSEVKLLIDNLSPKGLQIIVPSIKTKEDANDLLEYAKKVAKDNSKVYF